MSPTTVSHVLNRVASARVADATRETGRGCRRKEMGYQPNGLARALRTHRSNTLALLSDEIATTPYAGKLILGAQEAASRHGWLLIIMTTGNVNAVEEREISAIWQHQVDGVLYAASHHRVLEVPASLEGKPLIVVNAESTQPTHRSVYPDEYQGGYAATQELIFAGHTSIAFINTMTPIPAREGRLEGIARRSRMPVSGSDNLLWSQGAAPSRWMAMRRRPPCSVRSARLQCSASTTGWRWGPTAQRVRRAWRSLTTSLSSASTIRRSSPRHFRPR